MKEGDKCPKCNTPMSKFYSGCGGRIFIGCPNLKDCGYKEEIE